MAITEGKERVQVFSAQIELFWNVFFTSLWSQQMGRGGAGTFHGSPLAAWECVGTHHFSTGLTGYRHQVYPEVLFQTRNQINNQHKHWDGGNPPGWKSIAAEVWGGGWLGSTRAR